MVCICLPPNLFTLLSQVLFLIHFPLIPWMLQAEQSARIAYPSTSLHLEIFLSSFHLNCVSCMFGLLYIDLLAWRFFSPLFFTSVLRYLYFLLKTGHFLCLVCLFMLGCFFCFFDMSLLF